MKITIATPMLAQARSGNQHTAQRWAKHLRSLGHRVVVAAAWNGGDADALIALHARKSYASIERFRRLRPRAPLVVVLTGTDLYRDIRTSAKAARSLKLASRLVVLQEQGRREVPRRYRAKTRVVYQSADVARHHAPPEKIFRAAVVGHLRQEKDPFRAARALARLPRGAGIEVVHLGAALVPEMRVEAKLWMELEPRYRWLGNRTHAQALRWMARSHLLVVSSVMEGGASVICEAARLGVPVLASRVAGNIGMLGGRYPGYFDLFDHNALARLIARAAGDAVFYRRLERETLKRRARFAPRAERRALRGLLCELETMRPASQAPRT